MLIEVQKVTISQIDNYFNMFYNKTLFLVLFLLLSGHFLFSQNDNKYIAEDTIQSTLVSIKGMPEFELKVKDTAQKSITLVFEMQFDDSVILKMNDSVFYAKQIKTNPSLSMIGESIDIDYSKCQKLPIITIVLENKKRCIKFKIPAGFRMVYINRIDSLWTLEYSNFGKTYY